MTDIFSLDWTQIILKLIFVVAALFYLVYSFIMLRQVQLMKKTLITSFSSSVNLLGFANFLLALAMFIGFIMFL
jgi:hypothetical protein